MTFNIKWKSWLKCLRSDHWNQRYTLCIMGIIGYTCMSANSAAFYHALEYITSMHGGSEFAAWTSLEGSFAKTSYFIGFLSSSIPGSLLVDYMGGKTVLGIGCTCSGLGTIFTPFLTKHGGLSGIVVLRALVGAAEAVTILAYLNLLSKWMPPEERGLLVGVFLTAPQLGIVIGYIGSGYMLDKLHWFICFYIWGGICLVYCLFFFFLCYSEPRSHPFISRNELRFLDETIPNVPEDKISFVLRHCIKSVRVWCAIVSTIGFYWCFFSIVMDLPKYMHHILCFPVAEAGAMISVPFTLMYAVSLSSCFMADFLHRKKASRRWAIRKLCACVSSVPPAFSIVGAYYSGSKKRALTVCLFGLTLIFMSFYCCGLQVNTLKLSPRNLSIFFAVINTFGGVAAFLAPIVHGFITSMNEESDWHIVGWVSFAFLISGIVLHLFCFSAERHWWDTQVNIDEFDDRNSLRVRLGDLETRKKEVAKQKIEEEEQLKQKRKGYNGVDDNGGTEIKGILNKETEKSETKELIGTDEVSGEDNKQTKIKEISKKEAEESKMKEQVVSVNVDEEYERILKNEEESKTRKHVLSSKISENDGGPKIRILKNRAEESKTKEHLGTKVSNSMVSEEDDEGTKREVKGILKKEAEESKTKEQLGTKVASSKDSEEEDERTKIKGRKKEQKGESEEDEKRVTIVEPSDEGKDEQGREDRKDVER